MNRKYEFTGETIPFYGITLKRIKAVVSFNDVTTGDIGGWIEKESNLSHNKDCWVYDNAVVCSGAEIYGNAQVRGNVVVRGCAQVCGNAVVRDNVIVCDSAVIHGNVLICDNVIICDNAIVGNNIVVGGYAQIRGN